MKLRGAAGFTLIETLVSMALLTIGLVAMFELQVVALKTNDINKRYLIAQDVVSHEIESVKTVGYIALKTDTVLVTLLSAAEPYSQTFTGLPGNYQISGVDTTCGTPWDYCVYKGLSIPKTVGGITVNYDYTVKLSVNPDYLSYPTLAEGAMEVYWMARGQLKKMNIAFFVGV